MLNINNNHTRDMAEFYTELNLRLLRVWKRIPEYLHFRLLAMFQKGSRCGFGETFDIFHRYPEPIWTILYWITTRPHATRSSSEDVSDLLLTAHSIIMFLHGFDDHINDGEIAPDHLSLLLRSESWCLLQMALEGLACAVPGGRDIIDGCYSAYYTSVMKGDRAADYDDYRSSAVGQSATALIVPSMAEILYTGTVDNVHAIQRSLEHLCVAWKIIDDARDILSDTSRGVLSAVYYLLPEKGKNTWEQISKEMGNCRHGLFLFLDTLIEEHCIIRTLYEKATSELLTAAKFASIANLDHLSREFLHLADSLSQEGMHKLNKITKCHSQTDFESM